jgi:hypothetical protein
MIDKINNRIAALESELAELKQKKIAILQAQLAEARASLTGGGAAPAGRGGRGRKGKSGGWAADLPAAPKTRRPGKRGRKRGKRIPDDEALAAITKVVVAAGKAGISGRKVAEATGLHYPRVVKLMDKSFKKTGERKWSRYHAK